MKTKLLILLSISSYVLNAYSQTDGVLIDYFAGARNNSAVLQANSTNQGFLVPRLTSAQKTAIASPATGLLIYQTDGTAGFYYYNGVAWVLITSALTAGNDMDVSAANQIDIEPQLDFVHTVVAPAANNLTLQSQAGRDMIFNANGAAEKMRILSGGNVGIGNSAPAEKLEVTGNIRSSNLSGTLNRAVYADANGTLTTSPGNSMNMYRFVNNSSTAIPDNNTQTNLNIVASGCVGSIVYMEVIVSINHTWDSDLDIYVNGPNGNTIELSTDNGSSNDNYYSTKYTDDAPNCITAGSAGFDFGTYRPENGGTCQRGFRTNYYGISPNGTWQLRVWDDTGADIGTIVAYEVRFWTH